ncbi:hypothetical protein PVAND_017304 [Polypedilum vanderplanki]|uniref:BPTI/Kunitz inhibitor domain-containing protein n=1 Tax=Polypedilum vanderplanki TaxID=319348 RepID=A0A9J6BHP4_POLVA|nr:hypothetical protein PVAND_017304 [Polypedilum vanderplanki]
MKFAVFVILTANFLISVKTIRLNDPCLLPMEPGRGARQFQRYFFDSSIKTCRKFIYYGSNGNRNNFMTENECRNRCAIHFKNNNNNFPGRNPSWNNNNDWQTPPQSIQFPNSQNVQYNQGFPVQGIDIGNNIRP